MKKIVLILAVFLSACGGVQTVEKTVVDEKVVTADENFFVNEKFGFKVPKLGNFVATESEDGVIFRRPNVAERIYKGFPEKERYIVEIGVVAEENLLGYADLGDFLDKRYDGYSFEFSGSGVYVDEYSGTDSIRNFFVMNEGGAAIYRAYLKVPSYFYGIHKDGFEDFVKGVEWF